MPRRFDDGDEQPSADTAALGERFGLGRYESELVLKIYSPAREWGRRLRFLAIVLPFILIAPVVATHSVVFGVVAAMAVGCMWVVGTALWRRARVVDTDRLLWYADGLVELNADRPEPGVLRWRDATWFSVRCAESDGSSGYHVISCTVGERSGHSMTLAGWQGRALAGKADQILAPRLILDLLRAFDAGESVRFGPLGIDDAGITDTHRSPPVFVPWPDLRSITIAGRLKIALRNHMIDLDGVQNAFVAWRVIEHAASGHAIQIRYTDDTHLPPRVTS